MAISTNNLILLIDFVTLFLSIISLYSRSYSEIIVLGFLPLYLSFVLLVPNIAIEQVILRELTIGVIFFSALSFMFLMLKVRNRIKEQ